MGSNKHHIWFDIDIFSFFFQPAVLKSLQPNNIYNIYCATISEGFIQNNDHVSKSQKSIAKVVNLPHSCVI